MQLFVNTDNNASNGWYGFDYVINYSAKSGNVTTVAACASRDGELVTEIVGEV